MTIPGTDIKLDDDSCKIKKVYANKILDCIRKKTIVVPEFQRELDTSKVCDIEDKFYDIHKKNQNYFIKHGYTLSLCKIGNKKDLA